MAKINVTDEQFDFTEGGGMPSEGEHVFAITAIQLKLSNAGNPYAQADFTVIDPEDPDCGKSARYQYLGTSGKGVKFTVALVRAADPLCVEMDPEDQEDLDRHLLRRIVVGKVKHVEEEYQGKKQVKCKVGFFEAPSAAIREALTDAYGPTMLPLELQPPEGADKVDDDDVPF